MGAPAGNRNAANAKVWKAAIERALDKRGCGDRKAALDELAEKLLANCDSADMSALRELGDRLDGKPAQSIIGDSESPLELIHRIERVIVNSENTDS